MDDIKLALLGDKEAAKRLKRLIEIFTDPGDVVIDPCAGSGTTLRAAQELGRSSYGFEVSKSFYRDAVEKMLTPNRDENQIGFEEIMAV